ncbi:hypothetical protein G9C98_000372 [Cotesia typhae]|uniref:Chitin-binding type-2 domain-containing protein n=1 Tax=Cotesia typhae TaxID=2053667 RepID=A0A8J5QS61_9HYME|nr:hypothetical protein G9C98_000372 [Cotesia typhae]
MYTFSWVLDPLNPYSMNYTHPQVARDELSSWARHSLVLSQSHLRTGILWSCVVGLHRPAPRYSQQFMPETSFSCRNKIVGSYYADPETDCQLFHVCVSVAGLIQDYKFLCPNDTAFDQESQTCADWYDVDCEAATLYYASDNFDLYRLGSGLESLQYDSSRTDAEPQDHLQRSETNDPKSGVRKIARKHQNFASYNPTTTAVPITSTHSYDNYHKNNDNTEYYVNRRSKFESFSTQETQTTARPAQQDYNRRNNHKYNAPSTTLRPPSTPQQTYQPPISSTIRPVPFNNNNNQKNYGQNPTTVKPVTYSQNIQYSPSTVRPTTFNQNNYNNQYTQYNGNSRSTSTTGAPSTYQQQTQDYTNHLARNYNNVQRSTGTSPAPSTTNSPNFFDAYKSNNNNQFNGKNGQVRSNTQTTKFYPNYNNNNNNNNYAPTTYSPGTAKKSNNDGNRSDNYNNQQSNDNNQYYDASTQQSKATQYYDSTKAPKKATQYNNYDNSNSGKYFESSTANYDFARSQSAIGFSPASINLLAETPKTTTVTPRRTAAPTTYNPNNFHRTQQQYSTTQKAATYASGTAKPFSSTPAFIDATTPRPKSTKKNDYDYAYYDNTGGLEYDGLDLENVARNKESSKIARN